MIHGRLIGDTFKDAITWAQEKLRTTRPIAEMTLLSAIASKALIWNDGVILLEDDEEIEKRKISSVQSSQHSYDAAKKWTRIHFRNQNRNKSRGSGKYSLSSVHKNAASKFSNAAEDMLTNSSNPAGLPSISNIDEDKRN